MGFVVRPVGALVFGHVGDSIGRNRALTASIALIAVATVLIGVLPGYHVPRGYSIGVGAPVLLAVLRVVQVRAGCWLMGAPSCLHRASCLALRAWCRLESPALPACMLPQGLALDGEYCVACIYLSELAPVKRRGIFVACMMWAAPAAGRRCPAAGRELRPGACVQHSTSASSCSLAGPVRRPAEAR